MRVIAGKHRSRPLAEFKGREVRPTSDRAKEALFNILQTRIYGADFLDLFCGTGSVGIEALSRGAGKVVFVDNSKESVALTKKNLEYLKESAPVFFSDAGSFVLSTKDKFDIIFLDPPYASDASGVLKSVAEKGLLKENGILVYERKDQPTEEFSDGLKLISSRKYGIAVFDFYEVAKK